MSKIQTSSEPTVRTTTLNFKHGIKCTLCYRTGVRFVLVRTSGPLQGIRLHHEVYNLHQLHFSSVSHLLLYTKILSKRL